MTWVSKITVIVSWNIFGAHQVRSAETTCKQKQAIRMMGTGINKKNNNSSAMIQQNSGDHVMQMQGNPQLLHHNEHLQTWFKSRPVLAKVGDTSTMAAAVKQALLPKHEQPFSTS